MCDVHLVEEVNEERTAEVEFVCSSCGDPIKAGATYRHVVGHLDDGKPGRFVYDAHDDCYWADTDDVGEDGCFTWRGIKQMSTNKEGFDVRK